MVKKSVIAGVKSALRLCLSTKKMNQNRLWDNQLAKSIVAKSKGSAIKESRAEKSKVRGIKSFLGPQRFESFEKAWKKKKKEQDQRD